jgi:CDGSH-type Zn-finger protein
MSDVPMIAQKAPFGVDVTEGRTYYWCACGRSATQPYCDGSHKVTTLTPVAFEARKTGTVWLCGCKQSAKAPYCDGTHKGL